MQQAYNTTDSPVVVTVDGKTIGGHEHGDADENFAGTQAALANGSLIWQDAIPAPSDPDEQPADEAPVVEPQSAVQQFVGEPPPKSGAGSSADAWRTYAASNGVELDSDATRDDIITALDQAGVPTEPKE